ncbi:MAG: hypothetical protein ACFE89_05515 [Candidatus Hodarchaeota archaeon]
MSDESAHFNDESSRPQGLLRLGYLIQNTRAHPFSLTFHDLSNLFIIGTRAEDIYYNLFIQLCDDHRIPVLVLTGRRTPGFEEQVCECPLWHLDLSTDRVTFNIFDLAQGLHPFKHISILIGLFEEFTPLSPLARDLLQVILWNVILTTTNPTVKYLQSVLPEYHSYGSAYQEIHQLLEALPHQLFTTNYDNISLTRLQHLPTLITGSSLPESTFIFNLLLLKLLAKSEKQLPPLFLVDPPPLNPQLFHWLCTCYSLTKSPLVIIDTHDAIPTPQSSTQFNYILTNSQGSNSTDLWQQLTPEEQELLNQNSDHIAVRLLSEPTTRIINIF